MLNKMVDYYILGGIKIKTETKIAKENIEEYKDPILNKFGKDKCKSICEEHKLTCERWLEWMIGHRESDNSCLNLKNLRPTSKKFGEGYKASLECQVGIYDKKIADLKSAIKLYKKIKW